MKINYSSNNSGGDWWLKDEDWKNLEKAGWEVEWKEERWLGALAQEASKDFETPAQAIREFEKITGQEATDEGCNCCGAPHCFSWGKGETWDCASGDDLLRILYKKVPSSMREICSEEAD